MSRDANGNYTLPAGNPVVSGTVIDTNWANPTLADLAQEITNSLSRTGKGGMLVPFKLPDGGLTDPALSFTSEPTSGLYRSTSADLRMSITGADTMRWKVDGAEVWDFVAEEWVDIAETIAANAAAIASIPNPNLCLNGGFAKGLPINIPAVNSAAKDFWQGSGTGSASTEALDDGIRMQAGSGGECKVLQKIPLTNELVQLINDNNGKLTVSTKLTNNQGAQSTYLNMTIVTNSIVVLQSSVSQSPTTGEKTLVSQTFTAPTLVYNANDSYIDVGVGGIAGSSLDLEVNDFFKLESGPLATPFVTDYIEKPFWREVAYNAPWEKNVNSTGLRYSKVGNQVTVYGRVQFIGVNSDRFIGTIPVGFRPLNSEVGAMYVDQFGTNFFTAVYVASDGTIKITEEASTPYNSTAVYFTNGLTFEVA